MFLKWLKREKKGIVGKIIEVDESYRGIRGISKILVTTFLLEADDSRIERMFMDGHQAEPKIGDRVEVFPGRSIPEEHRSRYEKQKDGRVKKIKSTIYWREIEQYKILGDDQPYDN